MAPRNPKIMALALQGFKRKGLSQPVEQAEEVETEENEGLPMEDPRNASKDGETLYIDQDLFPGDCKVGEMVHIIGTVTSLGSKIGVTPDEVKPYGEESEGE